MNNAPATRMLSSYASNPSPCCDAMGHRPSSDRGSTFFCMDCGDTFTSEVMA